MAEIRIRVILNKGRKGIPLQKLATIVDEVQKFVRSAAADLSLEDDRTRWLAHDFRNGSLDFLVERPGPAKPAEVFNWKSLVREVATYRGEGRTRFASAATLRQYAKIAVPLDEDEVAEFGLPEDDESMEAVERFELTKKVSRVIEAAVAPIVEYRGAVHGVIHSLFKESDPPHFQIRDIVSRELVRCVYPRTLYGEVVKLLERRDAIVYVAGLVRASRIGKNIEEVRVEKVKAAPAFSDDDFAKVFGSAPGVTGDETTGEFLERIRDDADEA